MLPIPSVLIPDGLTVIAPVFATLIAGWISQDNWPDWLNAIVAGLVVLAVAALAVFLGGVQFTANLGADYVIVVAYCAALLYGPLRPLHKFLILGPIGATGTTSKAQAVLRDESQVTLVTRPREMPPGVTPASTLRRHRAPVVPPEPPTTP